MWHKQRLAALDFEASDKDPASARIVSCALLLVGGGMDVDARTWTVNPGIEQNPDAVKVHGLTDDYLAANGMPAAEAVGEIVKAVAEVVAGGTPLVGHNLGGYDLNLLNAECARHLGDSLEGVVRQPFTRVVDTMVLDKHAAPFRRRVSPTQGPYQMRTSAETYGLPWNEDAAHGAEYDALQSARVAYRIGSIAHQPPQERPGWVQQLRNRRGPYDRFDDLAGIDVDELHRRQVGWAAGQTASYLEYLRQSDPNATLDGSWPLRPVGGAA